MLLLVLSMNVQAQTKFDILRFDIPAGWESTPSETEFRLRKPDGKQAVCQIIIYASKQGQISNAADVAKTWDLVKPEAGRSYPAKASMEIQQADGWSQYTAMAKTQNAGKTEWVQYSTITNGKQYINFMIILTDKQCMKDVDAFYNSLTPDVQEKPSNGARAQKKIVKFKPGKALKEEVGG